MALLPWMLIFKGLAELRAASWYGECLAWLALGGAGWYGLRLWRLHGQNVSSQGL